MNLQPTIHIAIADDNALMAEALTAYINNIEDMRVMLTARHGMEMMEKIAQAPHQPDVCLIDIVMPVMDGYDTTLALKAEYPYIKVVALASVHSDYTILKMLKNGACGFVYKKDTDGQALQRAVRDVHYKGFHYCREAQERFRQIAAGRKEEYYKKLFTEQETRFLKLCCSDMTYEQIGKEMHLSKKTAQHVAERIGEKTGLHLRYQIAMYALNAGIGKFTPPPPHIK
jgi:DNA-binding NarL/FixJ family response regulator